MNKVKTRMTSIEILCALFKLTSNKAGTRLDRHIQTRKGSVLEKTHPIVQRVLSEGSTNDTAACVDDLYRG